MQDVVASGKPDTLHYAGIIYGSPRGEMYSPPA
jgi:hypothetical protein